MLTFTIITCTYNAEQYIDRTLDSVLHQTYPYIEHLIIDGLSKDSTVGKAEAYARKQYETFPDRSVIIRSEKDRGLYDAMNKGISLASGDYLVFLNAGDIFKENSTLEDISTQLAGTASAGVIYGDTDIVDEAGHFIRKRRLAPPEHLSWKSFKHGMLVCHQSFYASTEIAKAVCYNLDYKLSADVDWCIRIMKESEKRQQPICNTHLTLCAYLEGGMSVKNHRASLKERFHIMAAHYGLLTTIAMHLWFVLRAVLKK